VDDTSQTAPAPAVPPRFRTTPVAWLAHTQLDATEWRRLGRHLGVTAKSANWWLGDWVRFGLRHYDLRYDRASELTGYDTQTLMNFAYVAKRYHPSRRREDLSWSHHAELVALNDTEQEVWLQMAAERHLSIRKLRSELRLLQETGKTDGRRETGMRPTGSARLTEGQPLVCPHCGGVLR